ncbi:hypothetical protein ACEWY4_008106 [Coilia grayii]|uniref:Gypsy retrotransposon integrase-like protein 1 n=1 Tax=Coilia grayii TaxID=363190 RepID=A0ABD1KAP6_9TELE
MSVLDAFLATPSEGLFAALTKEQLYSVADHFEIEVKLPKSVKKDELAAFISERLKDKEVLPGVIHQGSSSVKDPSSLETKLSQSTNLSFDQQKELLVMQHNLLMEKRRLEADEWEKDQQDRAVEREKLRLAAEGRLGSASSPLGLANMVKFLPKFDERDPDVFFSLFENVACDQRWSDEDKVLLLQTVLIGRSQQAFIALSPSERRNYQAVKEAVLKCYKLIAEAYRQRFRSWRKSDRHTHAELARDLSSFFNRWLLAEGVNSFDALRDLMILEQFKNLLPDRICTYVNEHPVKTASEAAALADSFVLTHKNQVRDFVPRQDYNYRGQRFNRFNTTPAVSDSATPLTSDQVHNCNVDNRPVCHFCLEPGHFKRNCVKMLNERKKRNERGKVGLCASSVCTPRQEQSNVKTGTGAFIPVKTGFQLLCVSSNKNESVENGHRDDRDKTTVADYALFVTEGVVALVGDSCRVPVKVLRDTEASESFICQSVLPFSSISDTGNVVLIRGIGLQVFPVPLHKIQLFSGFVNGEVTIAVCPSLPIDGIDLIVGNNLAYDCVFPEQVIPPPVVKTEAVPSAELDKCGADFPEVFTACAVTRAMARTQAAEPSEVSKTTLTQVFIPDLPGPLCREDIIKAQKHDQGLQKYFDLIMDKDDNDYGYFLQDDLLLRRWSPAADADVADHVVQVVMPEEYRAIALTTAHGGIAGLFGVRKTYNRLLQHFYWPRVKRDVGKFVRSCHVCQVAGRSKADIKPPPLQPIASVGTPFEHLIIDCATEHLTAAQKKMKHNYDRRAEVRVFSPGDQVIALLPLLGSPFTAKYSGPYTVVRKVSDVNYLVATPERRKATQLCHVNLLKPYFSSAQVEEEKAGVKAVGLVGVEGPPHSPVAAEDGVRVPDDAILHTRLNNSETLANLDVLFSHLELHQQVELKALILEFSCLFSDTPSCTCLIEHIIDVGEANPILLLQKDANEVDRPVCYFSRKFNRHQFNYSTIEKEALALVWALQHFEVYVGGGVHPLTVYSDHNQFSFLAPEF